MGEVALAALPDRRSIALPFNSRSRRFASPRRRGLPPTKADIRAHLKIVVDAYLADGGVITVYPSGPAVGDTFSELAFH